MNNLMDIKRKTINTLSRTVFILCIIQPLLDVISYWTTYFEITSVITLGIRFALLFLTVITAFIITEKKKIYIITCSFLVLLAACHTASVMLNGCSDLIGDLTNHIRIYQFPVMTLCFITFIKANDKVYKTIIKAFVAVLVIIAVIEIISTLTGTDPHTYRDKDIGICGWFHFANTQSAIISSVISIFSMWVIKRFSKNLPAMFILLFISFGMLFMFATRLTYVALVVTGVGFIITLLICDRKQIKAIIALSLVTVIFVALFPVSPMVNNQNKVAGNAEKVQENINRLIKEDEEKLKDKDISEEEFKVERLRSAYTEYINGLVLRFGLKETAEKYNYSEKAADIYNFRKMKINYNSMLMEEHGITAKLFGIELGDLISDGENHDAENDFHGIYYLCGGVGLISLIAFLAYFAFLIFKALFTDFKNKFNLDSAAWGISLITLLMHVYATAGVLRRPNASFYLSITLAAIYYLAKHKTISSKERTKR